MRNSRTCRNLLALLVLGSAHCNTKPKSIACEDLLKIEKDRMTGVISTRTQIIEVGSLTNGLKFNSTLDQNRIYLWFYAPRNSCVDGEDSKVYILFADSARMELVNDKFNRNCYGILTTFLSYEDYNIFANTEITAIRVVAGSQSVESDLTVDESKQLRYSVRCLNQIIKNKMSGN